jgi:two-component system KDP operon response regulator KdpE
VGNKILTIDDNPQSIKALRLCLERQGYEVITAYSGSEGLRKFQENHPDLVILDIVMPNMDGWETCRNLREMSPNVPILILTVLKEKANVVRALALGADGFVAKPFRPGELVARIQALLRRANMTKASSDRPSLYDDGNLAIDFERQQIYLRGQPISLSPTEFRLLACLVRNAGRVVPNETLLTWVWGSEYTDQTHYVRLYIRYLRQKIEECPKQPKYILTEWGVGYRFRKQQLASALICG